MTDSICVFSRLCHKKNHLFLVFFSLILFVSFALLKIPIQAQENPSNDQENPSGQSVIDKSIIQPSNPLGTNDITVIVVRITKALLGIIGTVAFAIFVFSGIRLILSRGKEEQITRAKDTMWWALVGVVIALGSFAILSQVLDLLIGG